MRVSIEMWERSISLILYCFKFVAIGIVLGRGEFNLGLKETLYSRYDKKKNSLGGRNFSNPVFKSVVSFVYPKITFIFYFLF